MIKCKRLRIFSTYVVMSDSIEELYLYESKKINKPMEDKILKSKGLTVSFMGVDERFYVGIFASKPNTLAHECVHACNMIKEYIGSYPDIRNDEMDAYLVGELFTMYCESIHPHWLKP